MKSGINEIIPIYRSKTFWAAIAGVCTAAGCPKIRPERCSAAG